MIPVSEETRNSYIKDGSYKRLRVTIDGVDIDNSLIYDESMKLTESILNSSSIEFVGCIPSIFEIQIYRSQKNIKNKEISVSILSNNTDIIPLFNGYIDSAQMQTNHKYKKIVAYDVLYTKGNVDISNLYNMMSFPISLRDFRNTLFSYLNIEQVNMVLPNDDLMIYKQYNPSKLKALDVIKAICQVNGVFGIINRYGKMDYRIIKKFNRNLYPSKDLYPSMGIYPGYDGEENYISYYNTMDYQEYTVKPVESIIIRDSDDDVGVKIGEGNNVYIIQGNMFAYNLTEDEKTNIANNIYKNIYGAQYTPFDSECKGYPYLEVGDIIGYLVKNYYTDEIEYKEYSILKRTLTGIQFLEDNFEASGEEYINEFLSDVSVSIEKIQNDVTNIQKDLNKQIAQQLKVVWVSSVSQVGSDPYTFYCIPKENK